MLNHRVLTLAQATIFGTLLVGCIHPNIPSVRNLPEPFASSDSLDEAPNSHHFVPEPNQYEYFPDQTTSDCGSEGYLHDPSGPQPDTPEAPWPRFHPLPTSPVLGPTP